MSNFSYRRRRRPPPVKKACALEYFIRTTKNSFLFRIVRYLRNIKKGWKVIRKVCMSVCVRQQVQNSIQQKKKKKKFLLPSGTAWLSVWEIFIFFSDLRWIQSLTLTVYMRIYPTVHVCVTADNECEKKEKLPFFVRLFSSSSYERKILIFFPLPHIQMCVWKICIGKFWQWTCLLFPMNEKIFRSSKPKKCQEPNGK